MLYFFRYLPSLVASPRMRVNRESLIDCSKWSANSSFSSTEKSRALFGRILSKCLVTEPVPAPSSTTIILGFNFMGAANFLAKYFELGAILPVTRKCFRDAFRNTEASEYFFILEL